MATQTGRSTKKSGDFTGRQAASEAAKAAEQKKARAEEIAMRTAEEQREFDESVFDVTQNPQKPTIVDEVVEVGVETADDSVVVRVAEDIENMTFGYRNTYTFKAGGKYQVPKALADRLESLGLLWH
jgi:hypothetical protein